VARLGGIQAAKRTAEWIPLAHPLAAESIDVELAPVEGGVEVRSRVVVTARTGAEMEALVACAAAALTLYDMVKAVERGAVVSDLRLEAKSGGRSGAYRREA
jgi:cyclic pyranopterin phosphate synthase